MTKRQYMSKIRQLIRTQNETILERAEQLWHSGAIEKSDFEDNFLLPKAVMNVLDKEAAEGWRLVDASSRDLMANLRHF